MKVSEAIEILKTLDQDKELILFDWSEFEFNKIHINEGAFNEKEKEIKYIKESDFDPDKVIIIS